MSTLTIKRTFHVENSHRSKKVIRSGRAKKRLSTRIPRVSKLLALAISYDRMLRDGEVEDLASIARYGHVTRARVTQIMNMLLLATDIQEEILFLPETTKGYDPIPLSRIRSICTEPDWDKQRQMWAEIKREAESGS